MNQFYPGITAIRDTTGSMKNGKKRYGVQSPKGRACALYALETREKRVRTGTAEELSKFAGASVNSVYMSASSGRLLAKKYKVLRI